MWTDKHTHTYTTSHSADCQICCQICGGYHEYCTKCGKRDPKTLTPEQTEKHERFDLPPNFEDLLVGEI